MIECVLCDWQMDWSAKPWAVYLPEDRLPVAWTGEQPAPVHLTDVISPPVVHTIALVAHWAEYHRSQLESLIGPFETANGVGPRPAP